MIHLELRTPAAARCLYSAVCSNCAAIYPIRLRGDYDGEAEATAHPSRQEGVAP